MKKIMEIDYELVTMLKEDGDTIGTDVIDKVGDKYILCINFDNKSRVEIECVEDGIYKIDIYYRSMLKVGRHFKGLIESALVDKDSLKEIVLNCSREPIEELQKLIYDGAHVDWSEYDDLDMPF